jgi:hypothetical protein
MTDEVQVVETPTPEAAPPVEVSTPAVEVTAPPETETPPAKTYSQEDFDKVIARERHRAEKRAERAGYDRAMREAAERRLTELQTPVLEAPQGDGRPTQDKFQTFDAYMEALTDWKVDQKIQGVGRKASEQREQQEAQRQADEVRSKLAPAAEKYEDFEEVVLRDDLPITRDMAEAILELGSPGHDVAYHLGTHPKEAARIAGLGRIAQIKEIDKIAATLTKPPEPTKAPAPIVPNSGNAPVEKRLEEAGYEDFVKIRRKQIAARRGY